MWQVDYGDYNYPRLQKEFATHKQAKWFFNMIRRKNGVTRVELRKVDI